MIRLLLTSGRGPAECRIALAKALEIMRREADAALIDLDVAAGPDPDGWGPASAVAIVQGEGEDMFARRWIGSVQWVATSPVRPHHKRKNWFIGVIALPSGPEVVRGLDASDVRFEAMRAGGPGGQHQNKTESAIRAVHVPTGIAVVARDGRSQHRNKAVALERLAALLKLAQSIAELTDRHAIQENHDRVERGRAVRRFKGARFVPM